NVRFWERSGNLVLDQSTTGSDPGCVKTLRGITAPGIFGPMVMRRAKNAKICLPLGITSKSDFVFIRPRPKADIVVDRSRRPDKLWRSAGAGRHIAISLACHGGRAGHNNGSVR